jgi:hypothetical protein
MLRYIEGIPLYIRIGVAIVVLLVVAVELAERRPVK